MLVATIELATDKNIGLDNRDMTGLSILCMFLFTIKNLLKIDK